MKSHKDKELEAVEMMLYIYSTLKHNENRTRQSSNISEQVKRQNL